MSPRQQQKRIMRQTTMTMIPVATRTTMTIGTITQAETPDCIGFVPSGANKQQTETPDCISFVRSGTNKTTNRHNVVTSSNSSFSRQLLPSMFSLVYLEAKHLQPRHPQFFTRSPSYFLNTWPYHFNLLALWKNNNNYNLTVKLWQPRREWNG